MRSATWLWVMGAALAAGCDDGPPAAGDARPADGAVMDGAPSDAGRPDAARRDATWPDATPDGMLDDAAVDPDPPDVEPDASPPVEAPPAPLITEFVARNSTGLLDDQGRTSDWIELFNPHPTPIALGGFGLSDDDDAGDPWILPDRTLDPGAWLIVFASGDDVRGAEGPLHADFRLSGDGEPLSLVDPRGTVRQRIEAAPQSTDVAWGLPAQTLLAAGDEVAHRAPADDDWTAPGFADDDWARGATGLGRDTGGPPSPLDPWADDLMSHWTFDAVDDGDGQPLVRDQRPDSGRDVRLEGTAQRAPGRIGQGLTGGPARVLNADDFDFGADFTWALWMRGEDGSGALVSRNAPGIAWSRGAKALFVRGRAVWFDAGWVGAPQTGARVDDDVWHHVALTFRAADDRLVIYVDGEARFDAPFDTNAFPEDLDDPPVRAGLFLGQADFTGGLADLGPYDGVIDEVSIWRTALPPEAVELLNGEAPLPDRGPFGDLIATPLADDAVQIRARFAVDEPVAAAVLRMRFDDRFAAWLEGEFVAAVDAGPRPDAAAGTRVDVLLPTPAPGEHVLAVEAGADGADAERWVVVPEVVALGPTPGALVRPTPGALNAPGRSPALRIEPPAGVLTAPIEVRITAVGTPADAPIHYTTDGRAPTAADPIYAGPLRVDGPTTLRAVAIANGRAPGPVAEAVFTALDPDLVGFTSTVPVIVVDRGGRGAPRRGSYGDAVLAAWTPGDDGLTRLTDAPALVSRAAIRIRGQSSAGAPKPPYRIELRDAAGQDRSEPLLGLPPDADWVLHAPYWDKSLVRNALVYDLGRDLGLEAPRTAPFELFLRGDDGPIERADLRGVYQLVERIELGADRLDLPAIEPTDAAEPEITGGWVLKFEADVAQPPIVPGWRTLEVVEPDDPTAVQMAWVEAALAEFAAALDADDFAAPDAAWRGLIDRAAAVDQLIVNELFRDQDAYVRSAYLHRDRGGPWVMGPLWDYNLSAGVGGFFDNTAIEGWQFRHPYNAGEHGWFVRMMEDAAFAAAVAARWRALRAGPLADAALAERVAALAADLDGPATRNFALWPDLPRDRMPPFATIGTDTWDAQLDALLDWLRRRAAWLDAQWGG